MSEMLDVCLFLELIKDEQDLLMFQLESEWLCSAPNEDTFARRIIAIEFLRRAMGSRRYPNPQISAGVEVPEVRRIGS
jgi:hypothetical protein